MTWNTYGGFSAGRLRRLSTWKKLRMCWERITSQYPATFVHWRRVTWYWRTG
jgi:hypothetical protein